MRKKIVVIGGGTGSFTTLTGLKKYPVDLTAVVTMADDGGSTGKLRDEYGVLPPGDVRQCLVALSEASEPMRRLFTYRFENGGLEGHSFGNIFLTALEKTTGDFNEALAMASDVLKVRGTVLPVTLDKTALSMELRNGKRIEGESVINEYQMISRFGVKKIALSNKAKLNSAAATAISAADLIVVGPGNFYASLVPNFLVEGMLDSFSSSRAKKLLVVNLMNKYGHTDNFTPVDYVREIERFAGGRLFDTVLYNTEMPSEAVLRRYVDEGEPVQGVVQGDVALYEFRGEDLLRKKPHTVIKGDSVVRTLIRHDPDKLAKAIVSLF